MKTLGLLFACALPLVSLASACADDAAHDVADTTSSGSSGKPSAGAPGSSSGAPGSSSGSSGTSSSSGAFPDAAAAVKPADCIDLDLSTGTPLKSDTQLKFDSHGTAPVARTLPDVFKQNGDPNLPDRMRIWLHGRTDVGTLNLDPDPNHTYAPLVPTCLACATLSLDLTPSDAGGSSYAAAFAAVGGTIEIQTALTSNQTQGIARGVEFRVVAQDSATGLVGVVPGGACYWVAEVPFDTRRPGGCKPFTGDAAACGAGEFCLPTNAIGTDGECTAVGTKTIGQPCTRVTSAESPSWDSDCEAGTRCLVDRTWGETVATCHQVCDQLAETNACPAGTLCGGGYNLCLDETKIIGGVDPAEIGEDCTVLVPATPPSTLGSWAQYCGGTGKMRGKCVDVDGVAGPLPPKCEALFASAGTELPPGRTAGYIGYKSVTSPTSRDDYSTLWSYRAPYTP